MRDRLTIGMARMHAEPGERRDFLPDFVAGLEKNGAQVVLEHGYGWGVDLSEADYRNHAPSVVFASHEEVYKQDMVLVLRCPSDRDLQRLHPGACLISMLHYPTRPQRVEFLRSLGIEAISLDSIKDESGRRLVENLRSVAWNGVEVAYEVLQKIFPAPGLKSRERGPLHVTLLGAGAVGSHAVQASIRYGSNQRWHRLAEQGVPGVQVTVVDYDTTRMKDVMLKILERTDLLIDATQRPDPSQPVIPNEWIAVMPQHAVLLDLSVDPYNCEDGQRYVKGIEGIPQGNLDKYVFSPDDPAFENIPNCVNNANRRYAVSCYSWPGIHPQQCMKVYGHQLRPILRALIEKGGPAYLNPQGRFFERAISRAMLSRWQEHEAIPHEHNNHHNP